MKHLNAWRLLELNFFFEKQRSNQSSIVDKERWFGSRKYNKKLERIKNVLSINLHIILSHQIIIFTFFLNQKQFSSEEHRSSQCKLRTKVNSLIHNKWNDEKSSKTETSLMSCNSVVLCFVAQVVFSLSTFRILGLLLCNNFELFRIFIFLFSFAMMLRNLLTVK